MNKKDYWKILNHLNKKFCNNQIKINKIIFLSKIVNPNRDRGTTYGYYRMKDKTIAILKDAPTIDKIETLIHAGDLIVKIREEEIALKQKLKEEGLLFKEEEGKKGFEEGLKQWAEHLLLFEEDSQGQHILLFQGWC